MSNSVVKIWFSYAFQHLGDVVDACLFEVESNNNSFVLSGSTLAEFSGLKVVHDTVHAVVKRRKSVVTVMPTNHITEKKTASNSEPSGITADNSKHYLVTTPLIIKKEIIGVACFEFQHNDTTQTSDYLGKVETTVAWLRCLSQLKPGAGSQKSELALKITATALSQSQSGEAYMAVASQLASFLQCKRVSMGFVNNHDVHLHTLSNTSHDVTRQNIIKSIEVAMLEAVDQRETIVYPPHPGSYYTTQAHDALIRKHSGEFICSVPLIIEGKVTGAVMFERQGEGNDFDDKTIELCEQLAELFSPILHYRHLHDRPVLEKMKDTCGRIFSNILGTDYLGFKFVVSLFIGLFVFAFYLQWEYKVTAGASLRGAIERVITSPEEGFIKDASARPGDLVNAGDTLATLDDRDLKLEVLKWSGKHKQVSKEYRKALAIHDLSKIGILRSQLSQAEAQMKILNLKLNRTVIKTPISAVIVSGDYTRELGSPVERGQVLYKVSPLENYNVVLNVNESDISLIKVGLQGELTLSAAAESTFELEIVKITPVLTAENGINYFQVEATLLSTPKFLRPGMQGIAKIEVGKHRMLWIITHKMIDWVRLKLWSWW
ncbi:hypothetical protein MNBD_GAMMA07-806 [hydrothermal vent metagenome]|uniref:GAF domain-containing protein n=1 Tax=hydrothermal vent metagenome TaxID=652676 RepID=A0A3B0WKH9_9ZZZZ